MSTYACKLQTRNGCERCFTTQWWIEKHKCNFTWHNISMVLVWVHPLLIATCVVCAQSSRSGPQKFVCGSANIRKISLGCTFRSTNIPFRQARLMLYLYILYIRELRCPTCTPLLLTPCSSHCSSHCSSPCSSPCSSHCSIAPIFPLFFCFVSWWKSVGWKMGPKKSQKNANFFSKTLAGFKKVATFASAIEK